MGMLDQILGQLGGASETGATGTHNESLWNLASSLVGNHPGGLGGLLAQFQSAGLGQQADSWVSTGQNMPLSGDQVTSALGSGNIAAMAQKCGINPQLASAGLAALIPLVVDRLTPRGRVEETHAGGTDLGAMLSSLKSQFTA
jgi:uncharacterized protein YidB (DUF937 family)